MTFLIRKEEGRPSCYLDKPMRLFGKLDIFTILRFISYINNTILASKLEAIIP